MPIVAVNNTKGTIVLQLNVGNFDRLLRLLVGMVLLGLAVYGKIGPWGYIGIMPLLTGAFAFCPAYSLFRVRTTSR